MLIFAQKLYKECMKLLRNEYWSRLWIVQELCSAPKLQLSHGAGSLSGKDFNFLLFLGGIKEQAEWKSSGDTDKEIYNKVCKLLNFIKSTSPLSNMVPEQDLITLLERSRNSKCQDPRDKLYCLLGLASDLIEGDITVDYSMPLFHLICEVVETSRCPSIYIKRKNTAADRVELCQAL